MAKAGLKSNGTLKKGYRFAKGGRVVKKGHSMSGLFSCIKMHFEDGRGGEIRTPNTRIWNPYYTLFVSHSHCLSLSQPLY
ncbi:hypothetical protein F0248_23110 [Vibrio crassostreae]|nr:hypothetical protein [Vibrio crassostreae]